MSAVISEALDPLVEDGTITGDQKSAVVQALASFAPGGAPGGMNQGGQMPSPGATPPGGETPTDGATPPGGGQQGSRPDPSEMFSSSLDTLVEDGTITAEQETAIARALNSAMQQGGPGAQSSPGAVSGQTT
jgi:polyhydroxyalkanoate synthesis regulator phasin